MADAVEPHSSGWKVRIEGQAPEARTELVPASSLSEMLGVSFLFIQVSTFICPVPSQDGEFQMLVRCL